REETIRLTLEVASVSQAVRAAQRLLDIAKEDALALTEERDGAERGRALTSMGVEEGGTVPPQLRSVIRQLEDDQKKRATRGLRDAVDRVLLDLLSVHRDVLLAQLGGGLAPVNAAWRDAT